MTGTWGRALPEFPWDRLAPFGEVARSHPDGLIDLSVGTPVDPTPAVVQAALQAAADAPGYPTTAGLPEFRQAALDWLGRQHGVTSLDLDSIIPTIGSKELVAWLPSLLGLGARDVVAIPATAYPTYDIGARLAGCTAATADGVSELEEVRGRAEAAGRRLGLVWLNSPSNPTGRVAAAAELAEIVGWARKHEVLLAADECYLDLGWEAEPVSLLHPAVAGEDAAGLLIVHSLSKRSNLAGYRAGFLAGDRQVVKAVLEVRKHAGMMVGNPVQRAAVAAYSDEAHVREQRARYGRRREVVRTALAAAGFTIEHSVAGLYLWATRGEDCWASVDWLARRGVLAAPGEFYGEAGRQFVRLAVTERDERIDQLPARLRG